MGIINQNANMYTKNGELVTKAGCYPKNIYVDTFGAVVRKRNAGLENPKYFGMNHRRRG